MVRGSSIVSSVVRALLVFGSGPSARAGVARGCTSLTPQSYVGFIKITVQPQRAAGYAKLTPQLHGRLQDRVWLGTSDYFPRKLEGTFNP